MPVLTVIAGPNGSGKSTLTNMLMDRGVALGEYFNADEIARDLVGPPEEVSRLAQQLVRDQREAALAQGRDHAFETVMSHPSHIAYMARAASAGFEVRLYFVATDDPVINLDRVANRVVRGGHNVPEDRIVGRYHRCLANLRDAISSATHCEIFDNSSSDSPMRLLAQLQKRPTRYRGRLKTHLWHDQHLMPGYPTRSNIRRHIDPDAIPIWWLEILLQIKPTNPLTDGFIT